MSNRLIGIIFLADAAVLLALGEVLGAIIVALCGLYLLFNKRPVWYRYDDNYGLNDRDMSRLSRHAVDAIAKMEVENGR